ncbi:hypothetical protein [Planctomyces sp. SH-PL62]|uniref:hypothetical protein n=1 Tax=Planctomyces sp. SH-PL62 TaxID=1636152 RepID=UPI00078CB3D2|nr:hypothetical protein [Planctomyces sp. SH-PL62]AMV38117.1 hypothetical protein VT85_11815 [Planctomyces sp. SH-PL62]
MFIKRFVLACAAALAAVAIPIGCADYDADKTGDAAAGIGAAGVNAPDAPQTQEEMRKQQMEQEAAFRKSSKK